MPHCILALLLLATAAEKPDWQPNLVDNPSVEHDANRDGGPDGWSGSGYQSPATAAWDAATARFGRRSLSLANSFNPRGKDWSDRSGRWTTNDMRSVAAGQTLTLRAWIKTREVDGRASAGIAWFAGKKWLAENWTEGQSGTTDWRRATITAAAPPGADGAKVYLALNNSRGTVWFDDIALIAGEDLPEEFQPVDLAAAASAASTTIETLRDLPTGDVVLRGVPFHLRAADPSRPNNIVAFHAAGRDDEPDLAIVPIRRVCRALYLLHGVGPAAKDARAAQLELRFEDGQTRVVNVRVGREVSPLVEPGDTRESAIGWQGTSAALSILPLLNPRPDVAVSELRVSVPKQHPQYVLAAVTTADGPPTLSPRPLHYDFTDTSGWFPFTYPLDDTNLDSIDLRGFLDGPAGKHGFNGVRPDGHFYFANGRRARFFGTNLCGAHAFPPKERAANTAERLAKYGVNLVRIHAIDGRWGGLIDYAQGNSRNFNAENLDRLDYLFNELKQRGIYVYFDLLDYRAFAEGDGVTDAAQFEHGWQRSIKAASCFDPRMIELQQELATKFLTHKNPYTKLSYVDDPAVAVVEITNENSVFYLHNKGLTLPVYVAQLEARWNRWLIERYSDRAALARLWTNAEGQTALLPEEDPAKGNVALPLAWLYQRPESASSYVGERSPARLNTMTRFLHDVQRGYYMQMQRHLRSIGVKVPITGTNQTFCPASVLADAANDFTSRNNYWCHPNVHAEPHFTFRNLPLVKSDVPAVANPISEVASSSVAGKPMLVPEFNFPWPNEFRAEGLLLMTAYGCLQDWDGLLFFAYNTQRQTLEWFDIQSDPVRWGEFAAAATLFHRQDVSPARNLVHVGYSQTDAFTARPPFARDRMSPFRHISYVSRVRNYFFQDRYDGGADLVVASGYSATGDYSRAARAIVHAKGPWVDLAQNVRGRARNAQQLAGSAGFDNAARGGVYDFSGFLGRPATLEAHPDTLVRTATLPKASLAIGLSADKQAACGYMTERACLVPDTAALAAADPLWDYRLFAVAAHRFNLLGHEQVRDLDNRFVSDTGELILDWKRGVFAANTPRSKIALGFLGDAGDVRLGEFHLICQTPFAAVAVTSLDGAPIAQSGRLLVTAVARSENTGQGFGAGKRTVPARGRAPILCEPVKAELTLSLGRPVSAFVLDETGKRRTEVPVGSESGVVRLRLEGLKSPWCELIAR